MNRSTCKVLHQEEILTRHQKPIRENVQNYITKLKWSFNQLETRTKQEKINLHVQLMSKWYQLSISTIRYIKLPGFGKIGNAKSVRSVIGTRAEKEGGGGGRGRLQPPRQQMAVFAK